MDWTLDSLKKLYEKPFLELVFQASAVHHQHHSHSKVQKCHLISVKTGGCSEDCKYCAQSARYKTFIQTPYFLTEEEVLQKARNAKANGDDKQFKNCG